MTGSNNSSTFFNKGKSIQNDLSVFTQKAITQEVIAAAGEKHVVTLHGEKKEKA